MANGDWHTFRDIDTALGAAKGTAFRAFKQLRPELVEGRDFSVLRADTHGRRIESLRRNGRIYASSVNVVLLSASTRTLIEQNLPGRA